MGNVNRTVADNSGFIPEVWAQKALDVLRANIMLVRLIARDSSFEPAWKGKTLNIPYPGTFTAQDKAADTPATVQVPSGGATVPVTLSSHKYVDFIVEDFAAAQANSDLLERYVRPAAIAIGNAVELDCFALYSELSGAAVGASGTDVTGSTIRSARKALNDAKAPVSDRSMIVSSKDEISVLGDTSLQTYFAFSQNQALKEGSIGRLYGFDLFMSQNVPVVAGTPDSTKNLAFHRDAMIIATRPFTDPPSGSGVVATTIEDPETGLIIRVLYQYDMSNRGVRVGFDILYGVRTLRPTLGSVVLG